MRDRSNETKECADCERILPLKAFDYSTGSINPRRKCRKCRNIKGKYKITGKQFYEMLDNQLNSCLVCENPIDEKTAAIDHCHDSNTIRGLLCLNCNIAIGHLKHDQEYAWRAFEYLRFYK